MGRLIRFLLGIALIVVGILYGLRFGEQAYYSLGGTQTAITLDGSGCQAPRLLLFEAASRCMGEWTVAGTPGSGEVIGADASLANSTVNGRVVADVAVLPLTGSSRLLGLLSPFLVLVGLVLALRRRHRRRRSRRPSYTSGSRDSSYYSDDHHDDRDHDRDDNYDSGDYDSGGGDDGGGDSGSSD